MLGAGGFCLAAIRTAVLLLRPRPRNRETEPTPETLSSNARMKSAASPVTFAACDPSVQRSTI
ncbi:hypothetical protein [Spongiactinospora sp. 9N601]|uniref:hypothetical protein n=1 Tax=Spongiactinospora sp. 9N601 TaxID=3375149 RepID=UPI003790DC5C